MNVMKRRNIFWQFFRDIWSVFSIEVHRIFRDSGVVLIFFFGGITYVLLFGMVYRTEMVQHLPVAVVDESRSDASRRYTHMLDATREVNVAYVCNTMEEAKRLMTERKINGIFYFPRDYGERLAANETAHIGLFCDMSTFLYYRSVFTASSTVMLEEMKQIELQRYAMAGITGELAEVLVSPITFEKVDLFGLGGFASFLVPALILLVMHQTLFFGICMLGGRAREDHIERYLMQARLRKRSIYRVVLGRTLAYMVTYLPVMAVDVLLMPWLFGLPALGNIGTLACFLLPFFLSTIFFSMMISVLVVEREMGMLQMAVFSLVLLFLSGFSWPTDNFPPLWRVVGYIIPSTAGIQGFLRINSMGADIEQVSMQYNILWVLTGIYFIGACLSIRYINNGRRLSLWYTHHREVVDARQQEKWRERKKRRLMAEAQQKNDEIAI